LRTTFARSTSRSLLSFGKPRDEIIAPQVTYPYHQRRRNAQPFSGREYKARVCGRRTRCSLQKSISFSFAQCCEACRRNAGPKGVLKAPWNSIRFLGVDAFRALTELCSECRHK
jgi:hypothetical protein